MNHRIVEKPAFEAVGWALRTTTVGGENMREIPKFWGRCHAEGKVQALEPAAGKFGVIGLCGEFDDRSEAFTYLIGVEATPGASLPQGTQRVTVPGAKYAVFGCVGAMPDAIQDGWRAIMDQWLPTSDYKMDQMVNFELYPSFPPGDERGDPASPKCYTEIWIPIKKK